MATMTERNITVRMPTNDVFKTSTGVGHHYRPGYYFPDSKFHSILRDPLPPVLATPPEIVPEDHFKTTNDVFHDAKYPFGPLQHQPVFKKAPGLGRVHYLKDFMENIPNRGWRRPLSPNHQKTETQDEFDNKAPLSEPETWLNIQPFNLRNHHTEGPSKKIIASTENPKLKGRSLYPKDQEVLRHLDPYLTTYNKYHRLFDPKEWNGIAKKNIPTYWDCEEYPKAWGFGPRVNQLSKSAVSREQPPMRDTTIFKQPTFIRRIPTNGDVVPHSGMHTEYGDHYVKPSDARRKEANICPIDYPCVVPDPNPTSKYEVPYMYDTEYENYGKDYPTIIS